MCARLNASELRRRLLPRSGGQGVAGSNPAVPTVFRTLVASIGNETCHDRSHLPRRDGQGIQGGDCVVPRADCRFGGSDRRGDRAGRACRSPMGKRSAKRAWWAGPVALGRVGVRTVCWRASQLHQPPRAGRRLERRRRPRVAGGCGDHGQALFWYAWAAVSMVSPAPKCGPPPML